MVTMARVSIRGGPTAGHALAVAGPVREISGTSRPTKIKRPQAGDQAKRGLAPRLAEISGQPLMPVRDLIGRPLLHTECTACVISMRTLATVGNWGRITPMTTKAPQ
jgi:hypothetical protein